MARKQPSNLYHNLALGILVDSQDLDLLKTYRFYTVKGYAVATLDYKTFRLHRLVHSRMVGKPISEYTYMDAVRHIDSNPLDCRRSNIFVKVGYTANNCDLNRAVQSNNKSGINGVYWNKREKQWHARLKYLNQKIHLGLFDTLEQAARVAHHCRVIRSEITCSDTPMDYATMKARLQAEAKTIDQQEGHP